MDFDLKIPVKETDSESKTFVECTDTVFKTSNDIFKCIMCGECCTGFGGTYVTRNDIQRIADFIHCDITEFTEKFCSKSGSRHVLGQSSKTGKCIFFEHKRQCTIHPVKPHMCKAWPFIPTLLTNPENWNIMANSCPGMVKDIPHKDIIRIVLCEIDKLTQQEQNN